MRRLLWLAFGCLASGSALAQLSVFSPRPDAVSLTIYRDGIALVTETRTVDLPAEPATVVFQGVVNSLLPRSAVMSGAGRALAETDFRFDRLTPASLLQRSVGKQVTIVRTAPGSGMVTRTQATVLSADTGVVLRLAQGNQVLYCEGLPERLEFAEVPGELTPNPTLSVRLAGGAAGRRTLTVSYLAHGFSWSADYVAQLDERSRRMRLAGWVTLHNDTNSGFQQAQVQVVAGRLNLTRADQGGSRPQPSWFNDREINPATGLPVTALDAMRAEEEEVIAGELALLRQCYPLGRSANGSGPALARQGMELLAFGTDELEGEELDEVQITGSRIMVREELGDYQLYRLPWPTDLAARQTKQAAFLDKAGIKVERLYRVRVRYLEAPDSSPDDAADALLRWRNEARDGLGEPLPAGILRVFEPGSDGMVFAGEARIEDEPVGQQVEVAFARALDLFADFTLERQQQEGSGRDALRIEAAHHFFNHKPAGITIEVRRPDRGSERPVVTRSSLRSRRERGELVWRFELAAGEEQWLRYELEAREPRRD